MTDKLPDRWTTRDFPVLRHVAHLVEVDRADEIRSEEVAERLGIDEDDALHSIIALHDAGYIEGLRADTLGGRYISATGLTERGRRAVGIWPSGESVDALVDALRQAEEATDDPEERGALRRAASAVLGVGRDVMTDVMGAVIAKSITG
jgi:predicted ArsR family transcriptional regulator